MKIRSFPYFRTVQNKFALHLLSFFFFTLLLVKVSAVHVYCHQDSATDTIENCKLCDTAIENQQAEHVAVTDVQIASPVQLFFDHKETSPYARAHTSFTAHFRFFGRPPPAIV